MSSLVLSCEHGGNRVPAAYLHLFRSRSAARAIAAHRGMDMGALALARRMARGLAAPLVAGTVTRLLVDLNRSIGHRALFSEFSRVLDRRGRARLLERYYHPHREHVTGIVESGIDRHGCVLHVAVHSFTPRLGARHRRADFGLLYDPSRAPEQSFSADWKGSLLRRDPKLRVRRNYPYRGTADGLTTHLRKRFPPRAYVGIELEVSQRRLREAPRETAELLVESLAGLWA